jgi:hypothetical protein
MSPTCFDPRGFVLTGTGCVCSMVCYTGIGVSSLVDTPHSRFETRSKYQKLNINLENCAFCWFVLYKYIGWAKNLCAPDDYNTERGTQRLFITLYYTALCKNTHTKKHWKRGRPRRTWKDGIYTAMNEGDLRMGEWNNRRQWNMKVGRRRQTFQNRAIYT